MTKRAISALLPGCHSQGNLFVCDILAVAPKGDMGSMEHPVSTLATRADRPSRHYRNEDNWLRINPSQYGLAAEHDDSALTGSRMVGRTVMSASITSGGTATVAGSLIVDGATTIDGALNARVTPTSKT